jgi:hypothetical protein
MRRLTALVALFIAPFALLYGVLFALSYYTGEAAPLSLIVEAQRQDTPMLFGLMDDTLVYPYKVESVHNRQPDVLVIGTSRIYQIRADWFAHASERFFNGGSPGITLGEMYRQLEAINPETFPELVLIGLDQVRFIEDVHLGSLADSPRTTTFDFDDMLNGNNRAIRELFSGRAELSSVLERRDPFTGIEARGMAAIMNGNGYRNDGSMQIGVLLENPGVTRRWRRIDMQEVERREGRFMPGYEISQESLNTVEAILALIEARGAVAVGFSPPFEPQTYLMLTTDGFHPYLDILGGELETVFAEHNFRYFDFTDPLSLNATSEEFMDSVHAGEIVHVRAVINMAQAAPEIFDPYVDLDSLQALAASATNPFDVTLTPSNSLIRGG